MGIARLRKLVAHENFCICGIILYVCLLVCVCGYCIYVCSNLRFFVDQHCHPQSIEVVRTRAEFLGVGVDVGELGQCDLSSGKYCGVLLQYPNTQGTVEDPCQLIAEANAAGVSL